MGLLRLGGETRGDFDGGPGPGGWLLLPPCPGGLACENPGTGCVCVVWSYPGWRAGGPVFSPSLLLAGSFFSRYWPSSFPSSARGPLPGGERGGRRRKRGRLTQFLVCVVHCSVRYYSACIGPRLFRVAPRR